MPRPRKETDVIDENINQGRTLDMDSLGDPGAIEKVSEFDPKGLELEKFMNERVTILVHPTEDPNKNRVIVPNVNGTNQPIVRGVNAKVRRKFVEALARARSTRYVQQTTDPTRPDKIQMVPITAVTDPFTVIHDPNPDGRVWLESILAQE